MPTPPKSIVQHEIEGTINVTRHRGRAAEPRGSGRPIPPENLTAEEREIWDAHCNVGWLTAQDSEALALWCRLTVMLHRSKIEDVTAAILGQWSKKAGELGFTPAGRTRIQAKTEPEKKDPAERYFDA